MNRLHAFFGGRWPAFFRGALVSHPFLWLALVGCLLEPAKLTAHQPGNSSLVLKVTAAGTLEGEYHVADVDLESLRLMLLDHRERAGEDPFAGATAEDLVWFRFSSAGTPLPFTTGEPTTVLTDNRPHTMIPFVSGAIPGDLLELRLVEFFGFDPRHRVVASLKRARDTQVGLLTRDETEWQVSVVSPGPWQQFLSFTWEGVWHIWIGIDHILFLVALLLPSVLRRVDGKWTPVPHFHDALVTVVKVVTAFTVAHSVTLSLAALEVVSLPSKWVESVIALSVLLAAVNNLVPVVRERAWMVALGFGFVHGFGFANVLADLQLPTSTLAIALLSFNVGVELGQMVIVLIVFPVIFALSRRRLYLPVVLGTGSAIIAMISAAWVVDRVFELKMMPF